MKLWQGSDGRWFFGPHPLESISPGTRAFGALRAVYARGDFSALNVPVPAVLREVTAQEENET